MTNKTCIALLCSLLLAFFILPVFSASAEDTAFRSTSYPLPRFVTLGSDEVYVRSGPGAKFPIKWVFKKKGLPVEVILEYEVWRKIRDHDGDEGWVHQSLTSGSRAGLVQGEGLMPLYGGPKEGARLVAQAEAGSVGGVDECRDGYCHIELSGYKGWIEQKNLWGVYAEEIFK